MSEQPAICPRYTDAVEILREAHITENPQRLRLDLLPESAKLDLVEAKLQGFQPARCTWPDGLSVVLLIPPGRPLPAPAVVILAYRKAAASASRQMGRRHAA